MVILQKGNKPKNDTVEMKYDPAVKSNEIRFDNYLLKWDTIQSLFLISRCHSQKYSRD